MPGAFEKTAKYETDAGFVVPIRVQPETLAATFGGTANASPADAVDAGFPSAKVSGGRRTIGINARTVSFVFTEAPPAGYKEGAVLSLPILKKSLYDAIASSGTTGVYLTKAIITIGKSGEVIK